MTRWAMVLVMLVVLAGCAKSVSDSAPQVRGEAGADESHLAYEHHIEVVLQGDAALSARMDAVRGACVEGRFGTCSLLGIEQSQGGHRHGRLILRAVPDAVEPLVAMAADNARIGHRRTKAEDLGAAVADTGQQLAKLHAQRTRLEALQSRSDLAVSDLITLHRELASIDTQIEAMQRTADQQRHRIETNLLTLSFRSAGADSAWRRIGQAFVGLGDNAADGMVEALDWLGFGLPLLLVAFPLALLWRWSWRRVTRARREPPVG